METAVLTGRMSILSKAFPKAFREDVVRVARASDLPVAQVAKDFEVSESCLHRWLAHGRRPPRRTPPAANLFVAV